MARPIASKHVELISDEQVAERVVKHLPREAPHLPPPGRWRRCARGNVQQKLSRPLKPHSCRACVTKRRRHPTCHQVGRSKDRERLACAPPDSQLDPCSLQAAAPVEIPRTRVDISASEIGNLDPTIDRSRRIFPIHEFARAFANRL